MSGGAETAPCPSCGAEVPRTEGPTHDYMFSSPGCWAMFGEVLGREYQDPAYMSRHRLTVDAYAVQHPGRPGRASRRSVGLHLVSLCAVLERGVAPHEATRLVQRLADDDPGFAWLEPPEDPGAVTVADVHAAEGPEAHVAAVERWARSAWGTWEEHHDTVRGWLDGAGG